MPVKIRMQIIVEKHFVRYSKNLLVRNPVLEISLFCFLYKGALSRNSLKSFLNQCIRNFLENIFCSCFVSYSPILYSISAVSRHNRQLTYHFYLYNVCFGTQLSLKFKPLPCRIIINNLHIRGTEVVMR